ncbi:hypothetical protein, partial [Cupriavidus pauculus]|uniref:hypothetical protein n=1 Tax=Cupriavidus pauculus TaxID=82633 RepID=UPI001F32DA3D
RRCLTGRQFHALTDPLNVLASSEAKRNQAPRAIPVACLASGLACAPHLRLLKQGGCIAIAT